MQGFSLVLSRMLSTIFAQNDNAERDSYMYMGLFFAIGVMQFICQFSEPVLFTVAGEKLTKQLRAQSFKAMLSQDMSFFEAPVSEHWGD